MNVGIVLERRDSDHPWETHVWHAVAVLAGADQTVPWTEIDQGEGWVRYHGGSLPIELFRNETEGYKYNLSMEHPSVFVVLREAELEEEHDVFPFMVTVSPYEAQDYMDADVDQVYAVAMPDVVAAWVAEFVETHHVDEPFKKRKRKAFDPRKEGFDKPPPRVMNKWSRPGHD